MKLPPIVDIILGAIAVYSDDNPGLIFQLCRREIFDMTKSCDELNEAQLLDLFFDNQSLFHSKQGLAYKDRLKIHSAQTSVVRLDRM